MFLKASIPILLLFSTAIAAPSNRILQRQSDGTGEVEIEATKLVKFSGCSAQQKKDISNSFKEAQKIMEIDAIRNGQIDFNSAGALEYLGPSGLNKEYQGKLNGIVKQFATITPPWFFDPGYHRIHMRCDDKGYIQKVCDGNTLAYSVPQDRESGLALINFCDIFFLRKGLQEQIDYLKGFDDSGKYNMKNYEETRTETLIHEMLHIPWVGDWEQRFRIGDQKVTYKSGRDRYTKTAYGAVLAKILARSRKQQAKVSENSENLALYMVSQYVQKELGDEYPYLPFVNYEPELAAVPFILEEEEGMVKLNESHPIMATIPGRNNLPTSKDFGSDALEPLVLGDLADESDYPSEYLKMRKPWMEGKYKVDPPSPPIEPSPPTPPSPQPTDPSAEPPCPEKPALSCTDCIGSISNCSPLGMSGLIAVCECNGRCGKSVCNQGAGD